MKRVLIISYYFPPAGGSAVQRVLGMVRHLPGFGWEPVVVTSHPDAASYPTTDDGLLLEMPSDMRVIRVKGIEPYALYARWTGKELEDAAGVAFASGVAPDWRERVSRWVRANIFLPDARVLWSLAAGRTAVRVARQLNADAVVTSGPPQSVHIIGRMVHRSSGIPWVADFRDSWPDPNYAHLLPTTRIAAGLDGWIRRALLADANVAVAVSEQRAELIRRDTTTPVTIIENGFEERDFSVPVTPRRDVFELLHAGTLPAERNPEALWKAIAGLVARGGCEPLRVTLCGTVDEAVMRSAAVAGVADRVSRMPNLPHAEVVIRMMRAAGLLLLMPRVDAAEGIIPGKIYEYVGARRPILGIGPERGEAAAILMASGAGLMLDYDDTDGIARHLGSMYESWRGRKAEKASDSGVTDRYTRRSRARQLATLLDRIAPDVAASSREQSASSG